MRPLLTTGLLFVALLHSYGQFSAVFHQPSDQKTKRLEAADLWTGFNDLQDSLSLCFVTLLVEKSWDPLSGHAFLQLTKSGCGDSVVRYFGFYRQNPKQALFSDHPVPGKLTDDAYHTYHAFLRRRISPVELRTVLQELRQLSTVRYQTYHFNSVNFALRVMAKIQMGDPLGLPGHIATPSRLYRLLKERAKNPAVTDEIFSISRRLRYAGESHSPIAVSTTLRHP